MTIFGRSPAAYFLLTAVSAVGLWASFPPLEWGVLIWVALVPLFYVLDQVRSWRAAFGWSYGVGFLFFCSVLQWIHFVTPPGLLLLAAYLALYFGLFGLLYRRAQSFVRGRFWVIFFIPASWVILEYVRGTAFTGFNWGSLGHAVPASFAGGVASWAGVSGVSFLIVLANLLLKEFCVQWGQGVSFSRALWKLLGFLLLVMLFYVSTLFGPHPTGDSKTRIALLQPNISLDMFRDPAAKERIVQRHLALSREALSQQPDVIIWPETAFPHFYWESPALFDEVRAFARDNGVSLLIGLVDRQSDAYYNAAMLIGPDGDIVRTRAKKHLVVFGEYIPFRRTFPFLADIVPIDDFTPGPEDAIFELPHGERFAVLICFEDTLPGLARHYARQGVHFFVNMTNDAWFGASGQTKMHLNNAAYRTVETGLPLVRATNTGETCAVAANGRIEACVQGAGGAYESSQGFLVKTITLGRVGTLNTKFGDFFAFLCFLSILFLMIFNLFKKETVVPVPKRVLLIDDERTLHAILKNVLASHGFEVFSAMTGEEGLGLAASCKPDLILLDVIMPTIKGRDVCKRLKADPLTRDIPVIFLTAKYSEDDVRAELEVGAVAHVTKPVNSMHLLSLIKKTLST